MGCVHEYLSILQRNEDIENEIIIIIIICADDKILTCLMVFFQCRVLLLKSCLLERNIILLCNEHVYTEQQYFLTKCTQWKTMSASSFTNNKLHAIDSTDKSM